MLSAVERAPPPAPEMEQVTQPNLSDTKSPQTLVEGSLDNWWNSSPNQLTLDHSDQLRDSPRVALV